MKEENIREIFLSAQKPSISNGKLLYTETLNTHDGPRHIFISIHSFFMVRLNNFMSSFDATNKIPDQHEHSDKMALSPLMLCICFSVHTHTYCMHTTKEQKVNKKGGRRLHIIFH